MSYRVTSNESLIVYNTLETVSRDGMYGWVEGAASTYKTENGYTAQANVRSYEYRNGELNHVPYVALVTDEGKIVAEPDVNDSLNPDQAIERALDTAEWTIRNKDTFIENQHT